MMPDTSRPGPPGTAPRGHRWVPDAVDGAYTLNDWERDRKCNTRVIESTKRNPCNAVAVVVFDGPDGPEMRCPNHLDGCWIEHSIVMRWVLEPTEEEEA